MEPNDRVLTTIDNHIAHVRLNRPDKRNGLDLPMFRGIIAAGEALLVAKDVRAVVLSGEGKAFCAGLDFQSFMSGGPAAREEMLGRAEGTVANAAQRVAWIWQEVPMPVIAAVHGACVGGGLQIALGADIRFMAADAKVAVMEMKYGLIPDMGITRTLSRLVPLDVAKELTFTAKVLTGAEAHGLGLATHLSEDPLADAFELARAIALRSPHAVRAAKALWNRAPAMDDAAALAYETELQLPLLGSRNQMEAVMANFQKRPARFSDPD